MLTKSGHEILHNAKTKHYPNGLCKTSVCSKAIYREDGWEPVNPSPKGRREKPQNPDNPSREDSVRRAKNKVFDIAMMNSFDYFVTWTLNKEYIDRYDSVAVKEKLQSFLRNKVYRNGMKYLLIGEHHKDGAIHMHGLISGNFKLTDSGKKAKTGQPIYNMEDWKLGWSTVIPTYGENEHVAKYITKYVTKDFQKIFGNYYYAGGDIVRDAPYTLHDVDYFSLDAKEYSVPDANIGFKYLITKEDEQHDRASETDIESGIGRIFDRTADTREQSGHREILLCLYRSFCRSYGRGQVDGGNYLKRPATVLHGFTGAKIEHGDSTELYPGGESFSDMVLQRGIYERLSAR